MFVWKIFHLHGEGRNFEDFVAVIDDVSLGCDEDVFAVQQKGPAGAVLVGFVAEKFQIDGRRRRRTLRRASRSSSPRAA